MWSPVSNEPPLKGLWRPAETHTGHRFHASQFSDRGDQLFARRPVPSLGSLRLPLRHKFQYRNEPVMTVKTNHTYSTTKMRGAAFASRLVLEVAPVSGNACRAAHSWMGVIVIRKSP